jgi:hypothetical protein
MLRLLDIVREYRQRRTDSKKGALDLSCVPADERAVMLAVFQSMMTLSFEDQRALLTELESTPAAKPSGDHS